MNRRKLILTIVMSIVMMMVLTGCMQMDIGMKVQSNGKVQVNYVMDVRLDVYNEMMGGMQIPSGEGVTITDKVIDGENYKHIEEIDTISIKDAGTFLTGMFINAKMTTTSFKATTTPLITQDDILELEMQGIKYEEGSVKAVFSVEFPKQIKLTNGKLDSTGKKVTWDLIKYKKNTNLYADCNGISVSGVSDGGVYNKAVTPSFTSAAGIQSATLNKKSFKLGSSVKKDGKHTLAITAKDGDKKTISFTVDRTKPVIKGIKNNKTYNKPVTLKFSDKTSGVKSVKVNNKAVSAKKFKKAYTISKKGTYTIKVSDKAGNIRTTKFKIK